MQDKIQHLLEVFKHDKERLITEWLQHGKAILAIDYDDTIFHYRHTSPETCKSIINLVKWCQTIGAYIMIHTSSFPERHQEIIDYCRSCGLEIDSINENPIELPYGNNAKPYYNWQLCDRSGLPYAVAVLEAAAEEVLTTKQKNNNENFDL